MESLEQICLAIMFCVIMALGIWAIRKGKLSSLRWTRSATNSSSSCLNITARRGLTPHHALFVVSLAGQDYLVATHPQGVDIRPLQPRMPPVCDAPGVVTGRRA
jgi:hypothetical protein